MYVLSQAKGIASLVTILLKVCPSLRREILSWLINQ